jgi:WD40 repeat protein
MRPRVVSLVSARTVRVAEEREPASTPGLSDDAQVRGGDRRAPAAERGEFAPVESAPLVTIPDETGHQQSGPPKDKVFVSYSRRDTAFVEWLAPELAARGHPSWIDWRDIPPTARWREVVRQAIRGTEAFIFVLTPDSVGSIECRSEIDDAVDDGKRIVPLLVRDVAPQLAHPEVAARQWIACREREDRGAALDALIVALERDPAWVEEHTRLLVRANDWQRSNSDRSFLLRGKELEEAERWLENAAKERDPRPTQMHTRYILASRRGATRGQRRRLAAVAAALVVSVVLASLAVIEGRAAERHAHIATSRAIAATARAQLGADPELSLLLAMRAVDASSPPTDEAYRALREALVESRMRVRLAGLSGAANDAAFSPRADLVAASWGTSGSVGLFDGGTGRPTQPLDEHTDRVRSVGFDGDGERLITASYDGTVKLWDTSNGAVAASLPIPQKPQTKALDAALSPDGSIAVVGTTHGSFLWPTAQEATTPLDDSNEKVAAVAISGTLAATADGAGMVHVWDDDGSHAFTVDLGARPSPARALAFDAVGRLLIGERDGSASIWTVANGSATLDQQLRGHAAAVNSVAFSGDGTLAATGSADGTARVWDTKTGRSLLTLRGDTDSVVAAGFDASGERVVTASSDGSVRIWDVAAGRAAGIIQDGGGAAARFDVAADGAHAIGGSAGGTVTIWSFAGAWNSAPAPVVGAAVEDVAISPDDPNRAAAVFQDRTLALFRLDGIGRPVTAVLDGVPSTVAFDPTHHRVVVGGSQGLEFRDPDAGERLPGSEPVKGAVVTSVAVSADGRSIAYGDAQWNVWLWDAERSTARLLGRHLGRVESVAFAPNGSHVASASNDGTVIVWDLSGGHVTLRGHRGRVNDVGFSSGGTTVVSGGIDGTVRVWTLTGDWRDLIDPHAGAVTSVAYTPDGRIVASTDAGLVAFFDCGLCVSAVRVGSVLPDEDLMALAQTRVTRGLTCGERAEFLNSGEKCEAAPASSPGTPSSG